MQSVYRSWWMGAIALLAISAGCVKADVTVAAKLTSRPVEKTGGVFDSVKTETAPLDLSNLSDFVRATVNADSDSGIAKVTFEVDDQFRAEVKKPPYLFDWDTLDEFDGSHTLSVIAEDTSGRTAVQRLKVTIKNELGLGVKEHIKRALEAFRLGDFVTLDKAARKAFKTGSGDPEAIRIAALNFGAKGDPNRGFGMIDDRNNRVPPDDPVTVEVRSYLFLARAAGAVGGNGVAGDVQNGLPFYHQKAMEAANALKATAPPGDRDFAGLIARGDGLFGFHQFEAALDMYQKAQAIAADTREKRRATHRVALTMLRLNRVSEAELLLTRFVNGPDGNATSTALLGAVEFDKRQWKTARETVQSGVQSHNLAALIVAIPSDLVYGALQRAYAEAKECVGLADTAETQYLAQAVLADGGDADGARKSFQIAFLRAPLALNSLIERAFDLMAYDKATERFNHALGIFDDVLRYEPDNLDALAGRVAALLQLKKFKSSKTTLERLELLDRFAPDLPMLKAIQFDADNTRQREATAELARARAMSPDLMKDQYIPRIEFFVSRLARIRREVPLTPTLLDMSGDLPSRQAKLSSAQ